MPADTGPRHRSLSDEDELNQMIDDLSGPRGGEVLGIFEEKMGELRRRASDLRKSGKAVDKKLLANAERALRALKPGEERGEVERKVKYFFAKLGVLLERIEQYGERLEPAGEGLEQPPLGDFDHTTDAESAQAGEEVEEALNAISEKFNEPLQDLVEMKKDVKTNPVYEPYRPILLDLLKGAEERPGGGDALKRAVGAAVNRGDVSGARRAEEDFREFVRNLAVSLDLEIARQKRELIRKKFVDEFRSAGREFIPELKKDLFDLIDIIGRGDDRAGLEYLRRKINDTFKNNRVSIDTETAAQIATEVYSVVQKNLKRFYLQEKINNLPATFRGLISARQLEGLTAKNWTDLDEELIKVTAAELLKSQKDDRDSLAAWPAQMDELIWRAWPGFDVKYRQELIARAAEELIRPEIAGAPGVLESIKAKIIKKTDAEAAETERLRREKKTEKLSEDRTRLAERIIDTEEMSALISSVTKRIAGPEALEELRRGRQPAQGGQEDQPAPDQEPAAEPQGGGAGYDDEQAHDGEEEEEPAPAPKAAEVPVTPPVDERLRETAVLPGRGGAAVGAPEQARAGVLQTLSRRKGLFGAAAGAVLAAGLWLAGSREQKPMPEKPVPAMVDASKKGGKSRAGGEGKSKEPAKEQAAEDAQKKNKEFFEKLGLSPEEALKRLGEMTATANERLGELDLSGKLDLDGQLDGGRIKAVLNESLAEMKRHLGGIASGEEAVDPRADRLLLEALSVYSQGGSLYKLAEFMGPPETEFEPQDWALLLSRHTDSVMANGGSIFLIRIDGKYLPKYEAEATYLCNPADSTVTMKSRTSGEGMTVTFDKFIDLAKSTYPGDFPVFAAK